VLLHIALGLLKVSGRHIPIRLHFPIRLHTPCRLPFPFVFTLPFAHSPSPSHSHSHWNVSIRLHAARSFAQSPKVFATISHFFSSFYLLRDSSAFPAKLHFHFPSVHDSYILVVGLVEVAKPCHGHRPCRRGFACGFGIVTSTWMHTSAGIRSES
jgi:hypothetical protein